MKEQLYTIPLMDAFREKDECPFCFIQRSLEQHAIDFTEDVGGWYKVSVDGMTGYMGAQFF